MPIAAGDTAASNDWKWDSHAKGEDLGWLQAKGYKGVEDLIKGARSSEKLVGADKVVRPKDDADADGWANYWRAGGRPDKVEDYKLELPEGANKDFVDRMVKTMHQNGASTRQVQAAVKEYMAYGAQAAQAELDAKGAKDRGEIEALRTEYGMAWDQKMEVARRTCSEFGIDDAKRFKLYDALGQAETVRLLNKIGDGLLEDKRVAGAGDNGFGALTPERAAYEINQLRLDDGFMKAYMDRNHPGHQAAMEKMTRLQKFRAPE